MNKDELVKIVNEMNIETIHGFSISYTDDEANDFILTLKDHEES